MGQALKVFPRVYKAMLVEWVCTRSQTDRLSAFTLRHCGCNRDYTPSESATVRVVAKCRPFNEEEQSKSCKRIVKVSGDKIILEAAGKEQSYGFDYCYATDTRSTRVYQETCDSLVQRALLGNNVSILAIGATGSGKTHLLTGTEEDPGIVPNLTSAIYKYINEEQGKKNFFISVSFVEIIDGELTDSLNPHSNEMKIREHPQLGIFVDGLSELVAGSEEELSRLYEQGSRARKMGTSDARSHRKRSNAIFTIRIEQKETSANRVGLRSTITIADVAGSSGESGKDEFEHLSNVIGALKRGGHVPYRDSKVTRLLQHVVSIWLEVKVIEERTIMLFILDNCYQETLRTLQVGQAARSIKNKVKLNLDETESMIQELREEIARIRTKLAKNSDSTKEDVLKMEDLIKDLQIAKSNTWEERKRRSRQFEEDRKMNLANKGILEWVMDTVQKGNKELQERILLLQKEKDQLMVDYKERRRKVDEMKEDLQKRISEYSKLADSGKAGQSETKSRVSAIHEIKEKLKRETEILKDLKKKLKDIHDKQRTEKETAQGSVMVKGNAELRQRIEAEERKRLEMENKAMIADELEKMKLETEHAKAEIQVQVSQGKEYSQEDAMQHEMELAELRGEKAVVSLQMQTLQQEKEVLLRDLNQVYKRHKEELEIQQLQHFQTFRQYRQVFDEQKNVIEQRYRELLEDAVQDAIFLSTRNNELMMENQTLKQGVFLESHCCTLHAWQHPVSIETEH
ncbi:hypothetical protein CAPTEDRAFT_221227 [Capitella teleta]|uniref:Kinesin motor domain-containing protein n=1 Tax=Capitella teleta TaxID=283909 RepID=R7TFC6_CAPTE|nr:hypothetical protein CAPTEDRAFT_221227 [Capitella teleta]|eukprot:ELT92202.1 hypothetical protein CAPTEDRAFT_221227 [Capitella teleta]